jgi:transcriptional regulator with XRE-family HTH domain
MSKGTSGRNLEIVERGIGKDIKDLYYKQKWSYRAIAQHYGLNYSSVYRFLREEKFLKYDDEKIEALAMSEDFDPLSVITNYFGAVNAAQKELGFTAILNSMLREEIANIISRQGITALSKGENSETLNLWYQNSKKLDKLVENSQKLLEGYINLFSQVLDVQREVSYVKVVTELLRKEDPVLYKKLQTALDADPEAKRVLDSLSRENVVLYWDSEIGAIAHRQLENDS